MMKKGKDFKKFRNKIIIGNIEGSQSKPLYLKEQKQSLLISDIDGT